MKKLLSVLLAVVLCLAFSTMAFAAEETAVDTEELSNLVDEIVGAAGEGDIEGVANAIQINADKLYAAFGDIVEGTDTVAADEAADYVITAISELTGADMENVREIVMDAIEEYGLEEVEIIESSAVAGLVDEILARLESMGIDTTPIIDTLAESKVGNAIIGIYTGDIEEPTTEEEEVPTEAPEEPEIPVTGQASSIAAFAVLAVAAAGAYVCTRKKAE
mgnify:CR=1 FL=1